MGSQLISVILILVMSGGTINIFNFSEEAPIKNWRIVNDGVMGGLSQSSIEMTKENHGIFSGSVSLENNGGFASVQLPTDIDLEKSNSKVVLRINGDGKSYQCRLKGSSNQRESYVQVFETNGEWQTIELLIKDFYPQFRGRKLDIPNFNFDRIEQFSFLIANGKAEDFELLIDYIDIS
ncbi:CIA30 family protein [Brumimicrobium oceani]|uniref:CIA30 family protein n=1 Tax=Brumimicrobium oceani TaxID=2100725 RepID=A0A2U2XH71_9FLAO|nr:CIA30 family protein [Brumimicrobium oceani]PWH87135.1 CIA30 family protein [Brumimicrobium oceani]